jgi:hypothetical protein
MRGVYGAPMALQFGGPIGPFRDTVQQRDVPVDVFGTVDYRSNNPPSPELEGWLKAQLLNAIRNVIGQKMASGQLSFRHLGTGDVASTMREIIQASGLEQQGIQIGNLTMQFGIDGHQPAGAAPQQPQQQQQQQPQYAVDARFDVGGLRINASSDKGLDTQGLQNQLKDKAKSQVIWWGIGCGIIFLVGVFILGLGWYVYRTVAASMPSTSTTTTSRTASAAKWDGKSAFSCGGNDAITITGVKANLSETAITAAGNCVLTLVNVDVTAPTAIESTGNAQITVTGGSLNGSKLAVKADGLSKVTMTGTKVTGKTQAGSMAKITGP